MTTDLTTWRKGYTANAELEKLEQRYFSHSVAFGVGNLSRDMLGMPPADVRTVAEIEAAHEHAKEVFNLEHGDVASVVLLCVSKKLLIPTPPVAVKVGVGDWVRYEGSSMQSAGTVIPKEFPGAEGASASRAVVVYRKASSEISWADCLEVLRDGEWLPVDGYESEKS